MFEIRIFLVLPTGRQFQTSRMNRRVPRLDGDRTSAYYRAHLYAARYADRARSSAYVTRDDLTGERLGFGPNAAVIATTILYRINQLALRSYFDYGQTAWLPMPEEVLAEPVAIRSLVPVMY